MFSTLLATTHFHLVFAFLLHIDLNRKTISSSNHCRGLSSGYFQCLQYYSTIVRVHLLSVNLETVSIQQNFCIWCSAITLLQIYLLLDVLTQYFQHGSFHSSLKKLTCRVLFCFTLNTSFIVINVFHKTLSLHITIQLCVTSSKHTNQDSKLMVRGCVGTPHETVN